MNEHQISPAVPLVFVHIPKAAGTSLKDLIARVYAGRPSLFFTPGDGRLERFAALPPASRAGCAVVAGHEPFGLHRVFDGTGARPAVITVLREPVARVISLYNYIFREPAHTRHADFVSRRPTVRDVVEAGDFVPFDNHQVRFLAGRATHRKPFGALGGSDLERAKRNLAEGVRVFGLQDRMGETLRLFASELGWPPLDLPALNRTGGASFAPAIGDGDRTAIAETNELDAELYRYAGTLFGQRLDAMAGGAGA